ncbi:MAG: hypothetical protein JWO22_2006 [Frankiales bacterium]|nr:hypothetical protein [Frankiales bacterium]
MTNGKEESLHAVVWAYHAAVQRRDGIEARLRNGEHDHDLRDRSLSAAECVVEARIALYRLLMTEGWIPPPVVAHAIELDDRLLRQQSREILVEP